MTSIERFGLGLPKRVAVRLKWKKRPGRKGYEELGVIRIETMVSRR